MSEPTATPGADPATTRIARDETEVGSVFVSNYPAYSFWDEEDVPKARQALASPPNPDKVSRPLEPTNVRPILSKLESNIRTPSPKNCIA